MDDETTTQEPPAPAADPPPADPPQPADPPPAAPPKDPEPDGDIIAERAEHARVKAELDELKKQKAKAPAPPKKQAPPKDPEPAAPPAKRKARVSRRWWGEAAYDDD